MSSQVYSGAQDPYLSFLTTDSLFTTAKSGKKSDPLKFSDPLSFGTSDPLSYREPLSYEKTRADGYSGEETGGGETSDTEGSKHSDSDEWAGDASAPPADYLERVQVVLPVVCVVYM